MSEKMLVFKVYEAEFKSFGDAAGGWKAPLFVVGNACAEQLAVSIDNDGGVGDVEEVAG